MEGDGPTGNGEPEEAAGVENVRPPHPLCRITLGSDGDRPTILVAGEFDMAATADFAALAGSVRDASTFSTLVVDLSRCEFIDSSAIAALMRARHDGPVALAGMNGRVARTLELSGMAQAEGILLEAG